MSSSMSPARWAKLERLHPALVRLKDLTVGLPKTEARRQIEQLLRKWGAMVLNTVDRNMARSDELQAILLELKLSALVAHRLSVNHRLPISLDYVSTVAAAWDAVGRPPPLCQRLRALGQVAAQERFPEFEEALNTAIAEFYEVSRHLDNVDRAFVELENANQRASDLVRAVCAEHGLPLTDICVFSEKFL